MSYRGGMGRSCRGGVEWVMQGWGGVGHVGVWWVMQGGVGNVGVWWVMQGWVGHVGVGWVM